jgi:hypothetical protein
MLSRQIRNIVRNRDRSITRDTSRSNVNDTLLIPNNKYTTGVAGVNDTSRKNTLIHEDPNLRHGFTQVPNIILTDNRLTHIDCRLYCLLLKYAWQDGQCFPGQERLSQDLNCKPITIKRSIKHLEWLKFIRIKRLGQGKSNIYYIRYLADAYPAIFDNTPKGDSK